jgi:hypothetical protein
MTILYLYFGTQYVDTEVFKINLSAIIPCFAGYSTMIINYLIKNRNNPVLGTGQVNTIFAAISILVSCVLVSATFFVVLKQYFSPSSITNYGMVLTVVQSTIAVYTGLVLKALFEEQKA